MAPLSIQKNVYAEAIRDRERQWRAEEEICYSTERKVEAKGMRRIQPERVSRHCMMQNSG